MLYFDHNATSPMLPAAREAWLDAVEKFPANPSSPHRLGSRAEAALEVARERLAGFLNCPPAELLWTSGATEAANTALNHFAATLPANAEAWISAIEHPCVLETARFHFGPRLSLIPVSREGVVDLNWLSGALASRRPGFVAVMAANNETGVLQPWREAARLCRERGLPFLCDATQWLGREPAQGLGECDFVAASAHKLGGPRGVGFLKCPARGPLAPLLRGGPQEQRRRAGTENVPGVMAAMAAIEAREWALVAGEGEARKPWREAFERALLQTLPGTEILGAGTPRLWNTAAAILPETRGSARWVVKLDKAGCAVSTGSACASGKEAPSHVLLAMGRTPAEAGRVLRFSSGWETSEADWTTLLAALRQVYEEIAAR